MGNQLYQPEVESFTETSAGSEVESVTEASGSEDSGEDHELDLEVVCVAEASGSKDSGEDHELDLEAFCVVEASGSEDSGEELGRVYSVSSASNREPEVEFVRGEELGKGAHGRAFKALYRGSLCAAKEIHSILIQLTQMSPEERRRLQAAFQRECDHCSKLNHPNIVHFIGIYHPPQESFPVMIMELMDESLTAYAEKPNISFKRRMSILYDVAEGLSYLHSRNPPVIHRDLSPNNILLKHVPLLPVAKIADLGMAKILDFDDKNAKSTKLKYLEPCISCLPRHLMINLNMVSL